MQFLTDIEKEIVERYFTFQLYSELTIVESLPKYKFSQLSSRFQTHIIRNLIGSFNSLKEEPSLVIDVEEAEKEYFYHVILEPFGLECWHPKYFRRVDEEITGETYCRACNKFVRGANSIEPPENAE
jgi:hypothetical protein